MRSLPAMRIWDIHCHLPTDRVRGKTLSEQVESMLEIAQRVGIDRIGVFLRMEPKGPPPDETERRT